MLSKARRRWALGGPATRVVLACLPLCVKGFVARPLWHSYHSAVSPAHSYELARTCRLASTLQAKKNRAKDSLLTSKEVLAFVEDEEGNEQRAGEGEWYQSLVAWSQAEPDDCLLGDIGSLKWADVCARAQTQFVRDLVEGEDDRERVGMKLDTLMEAVGGYFQLHTAFSRAVDVQALGSDDLFASRMRIHAFRDAQSSLEAAGERYVEAHVGFWSDLAAVVKSQEDIPAAVPGANAKQAGQVDKLPAPYGLGKATVVSLPVPALLGWERDAFGGVEEQVAAVMLLKFTVLSALQALRKQPSFERLGEYASALGRLYRKGGRWFGQDAESVEFLKDAWAEWKVAGVPEEDPMSTGFTLQGVDRVSRRGLEDVLLESLPSQ